MKKTSYQLFMILLERLVKSGLPLVSPHAEMIWKREKTLIVKNKKLDLSQFKILCDYDRGAFGFIRCKEPKEINLKEFKALESKHRIDELEREKLWPESQSLIAYEIRDFFPFTQPRKIKKQETQTSIREVIFKKEKFDPRIAAEELKELSNKALVSLHAQVHKFWEERGARASDELAINAHLLIVQEMRRRGMEHRIQNELDEITIENMGIRVREPYVYIDDLAQIYGPGFYLKDLFLAAVGSVAVSGRGEDLDVWINFPTGENAIERFLGDLEFRLRSFLNENLNNRIRFRRDAEGEFSKFLESQEKKPRALGDDVHMVPDPEGKFTSYVPLARLKVEFLKPEERELIIMKDQQIKPGVAFTPLKARTGYGSYEFFDKEKLWKMWVSKYLLTDPKIPIAIEEKFDC